VNNFTVELPPRDVHVNSRKEGVEPAEAFRRVAGNVSEGRDEVTPLLVIEKVLTTPLSVVVSAETEIPPSEFPAASVTTTVPLPVTAPRLLVALLVLPIAGAVTVILAGFPWNTSDLVERTTPPTEIATSQFVATSGSVALLTKKSPEAAFSATTGKVPVEVVDETTQESDVT